MRRRYFPSPWSRRPKKSRGWLGKLRNARKAESRTFTLSCRMNVNAMRAGRQLRYLYVDANSATGRKDRCRTDLLSLRVDDVRVGGVSRLLRDQGCAVHRHCRTQAESSGPD